MIRASGRVQTLLTLTTSWMKRVDSSKGMLLCPSLQVRWGSFRLFINTPKSDPLICFQRLRSKDLSGEESRQDRGLPVPHLPPAALSFHSSARSDGGWARSYTRGGLYSEPQASSAVCNKSTVNLHLPQIWNLITESGKLLFFCFYYYYNKERVRFHFCTDCICCSKSIC